MKLSPRAYLKIVTALLGGVVGSVGVLVIFGWYTHQPVLIQISPTFVPMQFNTALGFLLSGIGILFAAMGRFRHVSLIGALVTVVGSLTLFEYFLGVNFGIDELFMKHYITVQTSHPGRMAPNTALCFILTGLSLLTASRVPLKIRFKILEILGPIILALGIIALFGYLIQLDATYYWTNLTRMAVHTASGFSFF